MAKLSGRCIIDETLEEAKKHGMKDDELKLVYTKEQEKEICYKCGNLLC